MKIFHLQRNKDASGVSGTGIVADGVIFSDGVCVLHWLTDESSIGIYKSLASLIAIHGHNGSTTVIYDCEVNTSPLHATNPIKEKNSKKPKK